MHPALLAHGAPWPSRVAIVSGDLLGATREVLRHASVTRLDVLVIDSEVLRQVKEHMPQLDNCSFFPGFARTPEPGWWSCSNDDRVTVRASRACALICAVRLVRSRVVWTMLEDAHALLCTSIRSFIGAFDVSLRALRYSIFLNP